MPQAIWKPNATVAAVIEYDGRYLLVEEETDDGLRFNQPAGHLEHGESLLAATVREAREETAYCFEPQFLVGIYQWSPPGRGDLTYLRFTFGGKLLEGGAVPGITVVRNDGVAPVAGEQAWPLDAGIQRAVWLTFDEVLVCQDRHRSPLVLQCIADYRAGRRLALDTIRHCD